MENKKGINIVFVIIAIILGAAIYKQFDFVNLKFEKPALAILYMLVFVCSVYFLVKDFKNRTGKQKGK